MYVLHLIMDPGPTQAKAISTMICLVYLSLIFVRMSLSFKHKSFDTKRRWQKKRQSWKTTKMWIERQNEIITNFFIRVLKCLKRNNYYVERKKKERNEKLWMCWKKKEISTKNRLIFGTLSILLKQVCLFFSCKSSKWIEHGKAEGGVS